MGINSCAKSSRSEIKGVAICCACHKTAFPALFVQSFPKNNQKMPKLAKIGYFYTPLRYPPKEKPKNPFWRPSNPVSACIGLLKKTIGKIFAKQNFEKIMIFKVVVVLLLDTLKLCLFKAISHT